MEWFLKPIVMAGFIHDMALMENVLMELNLCYTVVRPPGLNNGKGRCGGGDGVGVDVGGVVVILSVASCCMAHLSSKVYIWLPANIMLG